MHTSSPEQTEGLGRRFGGVLRAGDGIAVLGDFFFSSRRRHTRFDCDWSSDVCSSDLETCVVRFTTDIPHLTNWGTPLLLGPGSILDAHTAHERISVAELAQGVDAYVRLVQDRKSTRLNSSHSQISYAVFCLKKKNNKT